MTRIAHLSDLHLNGSRTRRERFAVALDRALHWDAAHLVLTGDLTASATDTQFAELASLLHAWPEGRVTLTPGNHDGGPKDWARALAGPLARFAKTNQPGRVVDLGSTLVTTISTQIEQPWPMARGEVSSPQLAILQHLVGLSRVVDRPIIVAMHHPPVRTPLDRFDGLVNKDEVAKLIQTAPRMHLLCGHDHRIFDVGQVHTAGSVAYHPDPLRIYDVAGDQLVLTYRSTDEGSYLQLMDDIFPHPHQV